MDKNPVIVALDDIRNHDMTGSVVMSFVIIINQIRKKAQRVAGEALGPLGAPIKLANAFEDALERFGVRFP